MTINKFSKYIAIFLISLLVLVGCGGSNDGGEFKDNNQSANDTKTYNIDKNSNHAIMGPLKGATVNVYRLTNLNKSIETTKTGNLGSFSLSLKGVSDNELLLVSISGGEDIDADDNGILDDKPTQNKGTIHAFATAKELRKGNVNVTLLSEIVYHYSNFLIGNLSPYDLKKKLDYLSNKLYTSKAREIKTYKDVISFNPIDKNKLKELSFDYTQLIKSDKSLSNLYHKDFNQTKINNFIKDFFGKIGFTYLDNHLRTNLKYAKIKLIQPFNSDVTSAETKIFVDSDANNSNLYDFVEKNKTVSFHIEPKDNMQVIGWEGCDKVSSDKLDCSIKVTNDLYVINPEVIYKKNKYAQNAKDLTNYHVVKNDNNYTVSLDLNATNSEKNFITSIKVDDIIYSTNYQNPFFAQITKVTKIDDNNYIFTTKDIPITKLFEQGSLYFNRYLTHDDIKKPKNSQQRSLLYKGKNGIRLLPPRYKGDDTFTIQIGKKSKNRANGTGLISVDIAKGVKASGELSFKLKPQMNWSFSWFHLESMRTVIVSEIKGSLNLEIAGGKEFDIIKPKVLKNLLPDLKFIVGPIEAEVGFGDIIFNIKGAIGTSLKMSLIYNVTKGLGANYVDGVLTPIIKNKSNTSVEIEQKPIELKITPQFNVAPFLILYHTAGIEVNTTLGFENSFAPISSVSSQNGGNPMLFNLKGDLSVSGKLQWTWNDYLAKFDIFKNIANKINNGLFSNTELKFVTTLYEFKKDFFNQSTPSFLSLKLDRSYSRDDISYGSYHKSYTFKIKNTGDKQLIWKAKAGGDLQDYITIEPNSGKLDANKSISVIVNINTDDLTSFTNRIAKSWITFSNLSNETNDNTENGTTTLPLNITVLHNLKPIQDFEAQLTGEGLKKIRFLWNMPDFTENMHIDGYKIYVSEYNNTTNNCNQSYAPFTTIVKYASVLEQFNNKQIYEIPLENFLNNKLFAGNKYCFYITAYGGVNNNESRFSYPSILEIPKYATLKSNITDTNGNPISNVHIYLTSITNNTTSDGDGNYIFKKLLPGRYKIVASADGYIPVEGFITLEAGETKIFQRQMFIDANLADINGTIGGKVQNALNGSGITNVTIEIHKGLNSINNDITKTLHTDSNGNYNISLKSGAYTFVIKAQNYNITQFNVYVVGNMSKQKDFYLTPHLNNDEVRIVLTWGANPRDLDSHLVKKVNGSQEYHIYYSHRQGTGGDNLDHDDTTSFGPETITINHINNDAIYKYYVHDFSNRSNHNDTQLKASNAKVDVYYGDQVKTFYVPNEVGNAWKVFEIVNGEIVPCTSGCVFGVDGQTDSNIGQRSLNEDKKYFKNLPNK